MRMAGFNECDLWLDMRGAKYLPKIVGGLIRWRVRVFKILRLLNKTGGAPRLRVRTRLRTMLCWCAVMNVPEVYQKTYNS